MKKLILLSAISYQLLAISFQVKAQDVAPDPNAPVIKFVQDTIDYGTIPHNADGFRTFKFVNAGKEPLLLKDVHPVCGCTTPKSWPKEPIQPGASGEIMIHYATDRIGTFMKPITITSNASNNSKIIVIRGNVLPDAPTASNFPPSSSVPSAGK
jgi:hypothetical protein